MASVIGTTTTGSAASSSTSLASSTNKTEIAGNFQDFLTLLTTQLKNQSPLDPLDTNQFTQQLVQFASVEQQLKTNDTLSSILSSAKTTSTANAASYVGLNVTADGGKAALANGSASWSITPAKAAAKATITIKDANGSTVTTKQTTLKAGLQTYTWDGNDVNGTAQADGNYTISVSATDASGQKVDVATAITGTVTAVDVSGAAPILTVNGQSVPLANIQTISAQ